MPWCPKCRMEYESRIAICPDCNVVLVSQLPESQKELHSQSDMVSVMKLENEVEGAVLKGVLEEQGIHAMVRDFIISQHQLPEIGMNFWGELLVLQDDYDNAKFIVTEYLNSLDTGIQEDEENSEDSDDTLQS